MRRLLGTMTAFALAALVNTASVFAQHRAAYLTRWFGRRGWYAHLAIVLPPWAVFLALLPGAGRDARWPLPRWQRPLGTALLGTAAVLWVLTYRQLGGVRVANGAIFGRGSQERVVGGVFRIRRNPMYDSYVLALLGMAFYRGNAAYLLLAGEAALLCHGLEARVER